MNRVLIGVLIGVLGVVALGADRPGFTPTPAEAFLADQFRSPACSADGRTVFMAKGTGALWRSFDAGETFTQVQGQSKAPTMHAPEALTETSAVEAVNAAPASSGR